MYFQIRYISQTQGLPPEHMLNNASKTTKFFYRDQSNTYPFWRLKTPEEFEIETKTKPKEARKYIFNCLEDMGQVNMINYWSVQFQLFWAISLKKPKFDTWQTKWPLFKLDYSGVNF